MILESRTINKFRLFFRSTICLLLSLALGGLGLSLFLDRPWLVPGGPGLLALVFSLIFLIFALAFNQETSYQYGDQILSIKNNRGTSSYDLAQYILKLDLITHRGIFDILLPTRKRLILIPRERGRSIYINFNSSSTQEFLSFLDHIEASLSPGKIKEDS